MTTRMIALLVVAALAAATMTWVLTDGPRTITVTADFPTTTGLYPGDDVRMVGVPVGEISDITARGDRVRVTMEVEEDSPAAAGTGAVIVPPGLLASRYVQLTKPWVSGPKLADGTHLERPRTAAPMELDDVTAQLNEFLVALGPKGGNRDGALTRLVDSAGQALDGNGSTLRQTLAELADALDTVGQSRGDIVATVEQLQTFVTALSRSDGSIRRLEHNLAGVTGNLARQHDRLAATIRGLAATTTAVRTFVRQHRGDLTANVRLLRRLTTTLVDRQRDLMEIADLSPIGTENIFGAANLQTGLLDARVDLTPLLAHADTTVCELLEGAQLPQLCPPSVPRPDAQRSASGQGAGR